MAHRLLDVASLLLLFAVSLGNAYVAGGKTVGTANGTLNFVLLGDWGGQDWFPYFNIAELRVAVQMGKRAEKIGSHFTIAVGDNFYGKGVTDVDDPRFKETFENVYTADSLQSRWYVICGNHDHYGNASAEIAYTANSRRWYMPDFYYTEIMKIPGTTSTVQFVFIDTIILTGLTHPVDRTLPPSGPASQTQADQQWDWIETTLQESTTDWIIVIGHYPVWSVAEHGSTDLLVQRLRPLLIKYNVSAYFCGHEHDLQYIQEVNSSVSYFVCGAAHGCSFSEDHLNTIPPGSLKFHYSPVDLFDFKGGFAGVSVSPTTMNVVFYNEDGDELYSVQRPKVRYLST